MGTGPMVYGHRKSTPRVGQLFRPSLRERVGPACGDHFDVAYILEQRAIQKYILGSANYNVPGAKTCDVLQLFESISLQEITSSEQLLLTMQKRRDCLVGDAHGAEAQARFFDAM